MSQVHDVDFILINDAGFYLHKSNRGSTDKLENARTYKTYQGAGRRCEGTSFKYILVEEARTEVAMAIEEAEGEL